MKKSDAIKFSPLGFALLVFVIALRPIESFDTFWQLQSGKYIFQTGQFIYKDTFSLAADVFRLEHCWLHDVILYITYLSGGYTLLSLLKPFIIALCGGLLLRWALKRGVNAAWALPVLALCLFASVDSWLLRPQLWTFVLSLLYLRLLYLGRERALRAWLWLVPLMLIWANLHAACIFGFALIAAFWVGELWRALRGSTSWRSLGQLTGCALLTFGVAFINPYGYRIPLGQLLAHLNQLKVATGSAPSGMLGNMEWLPPSFAQVPWFYVVMALWAMTIVWRLWRRRMDVAELAFFAGFAYMGFSQIRHTTLVALLAAFFLPAAVQEIAAACGAERRAAWLRPALRYASLGLLLVWLAAAVAQGRIGVGLKDFDYPLAAADFVLAQSPPGKLYNAYDWGGYLMWRLYPHYQVFVDGRSTSKKYFDASSQIENGWDGWSRTLDAEGVNLIITRTCFYDSGGPQALIDQLAREPRWALVFQDQTAVVYARRTPQTVRLIERFGMPNSDAYKTMLAEAKRLQNEGYERPRSWLALGRAYAGLGQRQQALDAYRRFLDYAPDDREARRMVMLLGGGRG
jgi:tetratricopeptide (TPR) repeat protein